MIPQQLVWLIMLLPLFSFVVNGLIIHSFVRPQYRGAGYVTIGAIGASVILSIWTLFSVMSSPHHELAMQPITWVVGFGASLPLQPPLATSGQQSLSPAEQGMSSTLPELMSATWR